MIIEINCCVLCYVWKTGQFQKHLYNFSQSYLGQKWMEGIINGLYEKPCQTVRKLETVEIPSTGFTEDLLPWITNLGYKPFDFQVTALDIFFVIFCSFVFGNPKFFLPNLDSLFVPQNNHNTQSTYINYECIQLTSQKYTWNCFNSFFTCKKG